MIVVRLFLRRRELRDAMGPLGTPNGVYKTVITILVESCALYAFGSILNIGPWCSNNPVQFAFFPILVQTQVRAVFYFLLSHSPQPCESLSNHNEEQVIAPFFIILRVADNSALMNETNDTTISGDAGSIRFRNRRGSAGGVGTISEGNPMSATTTYVEPHDEICVETETTTDSRP